MNWKLHYERWLSFGGLQKDLQEELKALKDNQKLLEDSFYKTLEFGTGGMRGEIGPGTNRMNTYTVRRAAKGLGKLISGKGEAAKEKGVVISYDNRRFSRKFALESAKVLGADGIKVYVFEELRPTPQLSFSVRRLGTAAGIMITASHNPPEYNGFKVYGEDGAQLVGEDSDLLLKYVNEVEDELTIETRDEEELLNNEFLTFIGQEMDEVYEGKLLDVIQNKELVRDYGKNLSVVFTPLHGASKIPVMNSFKKAGFTEIHVVELQSQPDENFSNVTSANPEEHVAFDRAIEEGKKVNADVLIATDPDGDRVGIAAKNRNGEYEVLTGNQAGALMLHYILSSGRKNGNLPDDSIMIQTIVTSPLGKTIAKAHDVKTLDVLTGFKYIAEKIREFEQDNTQSFIFGYEESYGYLVKPFVRDKDAVQAALLAAEVALYYKQQEKSLFDGLENVFETYGYYRETLHSFVFKGKEGVETMKNFIDSFRGQTFSPEGEFQLQLSEDYLTGQVMDHVSGEESPTGLPKSNVLKYVMTDGSWFCLRPSGTEPKLKLYFGVKGKTGEEAEEKLDQLVQPMVKRVKAFQD
ncbi:phosphoglucomutase [Evansella vedderi]|uniref:Phosphoglucomutase n=1 Tax=Evansella vedderi TaxID=38282 RepID=A0ABU0A163_9BACI|nr:phospho-sugar mutase [Evansella vedderi]MDQ0256090.1 phosphoglucomutase [Evansella vedderi]